MDPYGCETHMQIHKALWEKWYSGFFVTGGSSVLFIEIGWWLLLLVGPFVALWYFAVKAKHQNQYDQYHRIKEQIVQSGQPQWVPYDRVRLKEMDKNPMAVWP
jgi:hypothetical protein